MTWTDDYPIADHLKGHINAKHIVVDRLQPHWTRRKEIVKAHPEVNELMRPNWMSAVYTVGIVAFQFAMAWAVYQYQPAWWAVFALAYTAGAVADHAMWVLVHDMTHDAVFESRTLNNALHLIANLPLVYPSTVSFKFFHQLHHVHLNETYGDPDMPGKLENKIFGTSTFGKAMWLLFFPFIQGVRTLRYPLSLGNLGPWCAANWVITMAVNVLTVVYLGWTAFAYLAISSHFAVGLHPVGGRWVAEHYATNPPQETYSYYGSFNLVSFNIGFHNEHHDLPRVPWMNLPKLKAMAPEYYDGLATHNSYWKVLFNFIFNPAFTLESRVVRLPAKDKKAAEKMENEPVIVEQKKSQ